MAATPADGGHGGASDSDSDDASSHAAGGGGGGAMFRAKKWAASKMSDTKAGRAAVIKYIGSEGEALMNALEEAVRKLEDDKSAKQMKKDVIKLLLKASVCWQEHRIPEEEARAAAYPMSKLGDLIVEYCKLPPGGVDTEALSVAITAAHSVLLKLIAPVMKPKSCDRFSELARYVAAPSFLGPMLNDPKFSGEKRAIHDQMVAIVEAHGVHSGSTLLCSVPGCLLTRVELRGSAYCQGHHAMKFSRPPTLADFLKNEEHLRYFQSYAVGEAGLRNQLDFVIKVNSFKSIHSRSIMQDRAKVVFDTYLAAGGPKHVDVSRDIVDAIERVLEHPNASLFTPAYQACFERLEKVFDDSFVGSVQYREFSKVHLGVEMPPMPPSAIARIRAGESGAINFSAEMERMAASRQATQRRLSAAFATEDDEATAFIDTAATPRYDTPSSGAAAATGGAGGAGGPSARSGDSGAAVAAGS